MAVYSGPGQEGYRRLCQRWSDHCVTVLSMPQVEAARTEYAPPRRLQQLPSWLMSEVAMHAGRLLSDALAQEGMRKPHFSVLSALAEQGAASQAALGRRLWIDRSDLHAILGELERDGFVARVRDEQDRRRNLVELTPAGAAALIRLDVRIQAAQDVLLEPLSATDRQHLRRILKRLVEHNTQVLLQPTSAV
jgi:MarR family transcriptional regulator, lower aerobic nicotinate degradation pathway regulator